MKNASQVITAIKRSKTQKTTTKWVNWANLNLDYEEAQKVMKFINTRNQN